MAAPFPDTLKNLGPAKLATLGGSLLVLLLLFGTLIFKAATPPMTLLYGGMEAAEAAKVTEKLTAQGIPYEVRDGGALYVPRDKVNELRLKVAGEGLIGASTAGYEIFDKGSSFGTTSLVQDINARRALEGELSRTISSLPQVESVRIHLVLPKRKLFTTQQTPPSASVALNLGGRTLTEEQVQSITHLVAAAVPDLTPERVTLVDNHGNLLSSGEGEGSKTYALTTQDKLRRQVEEEYETRVTRMLERVVGPNKANVKVSADIDFDRVEENSELFNPEQQVARSEQRSENNKQNAASEGSAPVGTGANIPGQDTSAGGAGSSKETETGNQETINYEISKTVRHYVKEGGDVKRLSVAALVEGKYVDKDGKQTYVPYTEEEMDKFRTLIKTSIGFKEDRGDTVQVVDMAFAGIEEPIESTPLLSKDDYFTLAQYGLLISAMLLIVFTVIKPLIKGISAPAHSAAVAGALTARGAAAASLTGSAPTTAAFAAPEGGPDTMMDLEQVEGRVRESSVKKVKEIIDQYPEETISTVRSWLAVDNKDA